MNFNFFFNQHLFFGPGKLDMLIDIIPPLGKNILMITGSHSFIESQHWEKLNRSLHTASINYHRTKIVKEPSPDDIDSIVTFCREKQIDLVIAIGGGSVLDAGKAVSAMLTKKEKISCFLEGIGDLVHDGRKLPFIAVPTTAGTGSESTKNAVISEVGRKGFKKSLRHDNLIPDIALIDPNLTSACPRHVTSACGMDALTQLIESLVSTQSTPITDSLAYSGISGFKKALFCAVLEDPVNISARSKLSYASYLSGITLANAGLGLVHGFAGAIGGLFDIPHGIVCGTLLAETTKQNIKAMKDSGRKNQALLKYSKIGHLLKNTSDRQAGNGNDYILSDILQEWTDLFELPLLGKFGIKRDDIELIVDITSQKCNPIQLPRETLIQILNTRL